MAILSLNQTLKFHTIYKPPFSNVYYPFLSLIEYTNAYVKNHFHNIKWDSSEFDYNDVLDHVKPIFNYKPQFIYVKGCEKVNHLINLYLKNIKVNTPVPKIMRKKHNLFVT